MMISRPGIRFALTLVLAAAFYSTASMAMRDPLPFAEVVSMSKRGDSPSSINAAMRSARTTYALRGSDFGKLAAIGMSPVVLDEIQQRFSDDVDLLTRYWVVGEFMGRCIPCYPQQVDLTGIDSGIAPKTFPRHCARRSGNRSGCRTGSRRSTTGRTASPSSKCARCRRPARATPRSSRPSTPRYCRKPSVRVAAPSRSAATWCQASAALSSRTSVPKACPIRCSTDCR